MKKPASSFWVKDGSLTFYDESGAELITLHNPEVLEWFHGVEQHERHGQVYRIEMICSIRQPVASLPDMNSGSRNFLVQGEKALEAMARQHARHHKDCKFEMDEYHCVRECPVLQEVDRAAREEVEKNLHEAGIIEDPDIDGGLLG